MVRACVGDMLRLRLHLAYWWVGAWAGLCILVFFGRALGGRGIWRLFDVGEGHDILSLSFGTLVRYSWHTASYSGLALVSSGEGDTWKRIGAWVMFVKEPVATDWSAGERRFTDDPLLCFCERLERRGNCLSLDLSSCTDPYRQKPPFLARETDKNEYTQEGQWVSLPLFD